MIEWIDHFLYQLAAFLHLPIFVSLLAMVVWTTISGGALLGSWVRRQSGMHPLADRFFSDHADEIATIAEDPLHADIRMTTLVRRWEAQHNNRLDSIRFLIKTGPSIGLVGTLIPMGQALASLSGGDMAAMAGNMVTAFTSTIIGLVCGTAAYLITLQREKWLRAEFLACETRAETLLRKLSLESNTPTPQS